MAGSRSRLAYCRAVILAVAAAGVICLAVGLVSPVGPCRIQENGPAVCNDPGAAWTWAGDVLLAAAAVAAITAAAVRRYRRRGA